MGRFSNNMGGTRHQMIEESHDEHPEMVKVLIELEQLGAHAYSGQGHCTAVSVGLIGFDRMTTLPTALFALKDELGDLNLKNCGDLKFLPAELEGFVRLHELNLSGCKSLEHPLPDLQQRALGGLTVHTSGASIAVQEWAKFGFKEHSYPTGCTHGEHEYQLQ